MTCVCDSIQNRKHGHEANAYYFRKLPDNCWHDVPKVRVQPTVVFFSDMWHGFSSAHYPYQNCYFSCLLVSFVTALWMCMVMFLYELICVQINTHRYLYQQQRQIGRVVSKLSQYSHGSVQQLFFTPCFLSPRSTRIVSVIPFGEKC